MLKSFCQRRGIHLVPRLANDSVWSQSGIKGLYSAKGYQMAWTDYQKYLTSKLSILTSGTDLEQFNAFRTMLITGPVKHQSSIFHYASQSHNNHFFFEQFVQDPENNKSVLSRDLNNKVTQQFGGLEQLKKAIFDKALSSNTNGWVFLVENADKQFEIKLIHNDGTPYLYSRNQSVKMVSPITGNDYAKYLQNVEALEKGVRDETMPLLGISLWDYSYICDYGVDEKEKYLENVWKAIDWEKISKRLFALP